ncbi:MAG TPA: DEAD/DEAH box helicase [Cyclobacteriaceae bacterium]|nr:DEAD/DEAH box helicase [Cyclobacteriaceae bacterium]
MESSTQNSTWTDFKLNKQLLDAIAENNFADPTDIQRKSIPLVLGGQQVIGIAQTGTGKTAAYMLPLFMKVKFAQGDDARALILVPTKELVLQVAEQAKKLSKYTDLRIMPIYGGVGIKSQIAVIKKGIDIIIATPGRFLELYQQSELPVKQIKTLVIDEADRMMDMGFRHQLRKIFEIIPQKRQNLLFSATFPDKVEKLSQDFLEFPVRIEITPQATAAKQVTQELYHVPNMKTKINFLEYLFSKEEFSRVMIFARTKETANNIYKFLERKITKSVRVIHSNKSQNTRINAMNDFKDGDIRVLVSTDVAARGIDVEKVSHVINFDVPDHYEDYVHRIGRTGRAFQEGTAITFVTKAELYHIVKIEKLIREKIKVKDLPKEVKIEETSFEETQAINREIDRQNRLDNPDFLGAFHEKKIKR